MWSKKDEAGNPQYPEPARAGMPQHSAGSTPLPMPPAARTSTAATASIGSAMRIKGEIYAREELMVDGDVEGVMESESLLTVGPNGKVRANIKAREVVIFGSVHGNVEVSGKIAIREQGSLIGNIKSSGISIDDGAYFKGSIDITRPDPKAAKHDQAKHEPRVVAQAS